MSEKTAASLARLDALLPLLQNFPPTDRKAELIETAEALRRAVAAFHMEAIRFRMFGVDRLLRLTGDDAASRQLFNELRHELESAGFHTRSHTAP
jgi:2'-5' RNA ligase